MTQNLQEESLSVKTALSVSGLKQMVQRRLSRKKDRYHLYISLACPWAHRMLIFRKLKKLEDVINFFGSNS